MARMRSPGATTTGYAQPSGMEEFQNFDPTASFDAPPLDVGGYTPPNGNTGVSGYGNGGNPPPSPMPWPEETPPEPPLVPQSPVNPNAAGAFGADAYRPIQGFDFGKIAGTTPFDSPDKYSDELRAFSRGLGMGGVNIGRNDLGGMINWLKANGYGNASAVGDDKIDFGAGNGPIDVINSLGQIWFQNGDDRFAPAPQAAAPAPGTISLAGDTVQNGQPAGGSAAPAAPPVDIMAELAKLFPNGLFNQDVVNRRTENAAQALGRDRKSRVASNQAALADRGLIGDGPEGTMFANVDRDIADRYAEAVSGIYANESENADQRMMQALGLYSNLTQADLDRAVDWFNAQTGRTGMEHDFALGQGNLGLGNVRAANDYNLALGRLGLDREIAGNQLNNQSIDQYINLLQLLLQGAGTAANGYY